MNLDHDIVQVSKLREDQKKGLHQKRNTFFPEFYVFTKSGHLRSDEHHSQLIGEDADVDHTQTIGGIQSNYWGDTFPHPPRDSAPLRTFVTKCKYGTMKKIKLQPNAM